MRRISFLKTDTREPEKTPLIDIIFLLLIFFFVSIASQSINSRDKDKSPTITRQKLMLLSNANVISDDSFVLVEVKRVTIQIAVQLNALKIELKNYFTQAGLPVPAILNSMVSAAGFRIFIRPLDELNQDVENLLAIGHSPGTSSIANKLVGEFPRILTYNTDAELSNYISSFPADNVFDRWVNNNDVKLHLRFERDVPVKAFLIFYKLSENLNLSFKKLEVRVINQKTD